MLLLRFEKMHGLGNDFVIVDGRKTPVRLREVEARKLCDRRAGVGCDQAILLQPSARAAAFMRIYNADGGEVAACGNATRCVAWLLMRESGAPSVVVETAAGLLECGDAGEGRVTVNMGPPRLGWREIPLSRETDTRSVSVGGMQEGVAVGMGNPHIVFFMENIAAAPLAEIGPTLERDALFPDRVNVTLAQVEKEGMIHLRTWERGVGLTPACGTAACAAQVAARRRGLTGPEVTARMEGGDLTIRWDGAENDPLSPVLMTGPIVHVFSGEMEWPDAAHYG